MLRFQSEDEMIVWTLAVSGVSNSSWSAENAANYADRVVEEFRKRVSSESESE